MKFVISTIILFTIFSTNINAGNNYRPNYKNFNWNNLEVVWLEENKFPTYNLIFYFADGALSDKSTEIGATQMAFDLLTSGTRRFNQKEINDNLEYYGSSYGASVTHEYATYNVSGLVKDIVPTVKQICHLFKDATYPKNEVRKSVKLRRNGIKNLINSHSAMADRAFRKVSMGGSPYEFPVGGNLKSLKKVTRKKLLGKIDYFKTKVKKRIYISGPKEALVIKDIITGECGFNVDTSSFVRTVKEPIKSPEKKIVLVTVPKANQTQVRVGRILNQEEIKNTPLLMFTSKFLGGGFTSQLMKAIRVEAGLSYSVWAFASGQKEYGRSGISTFTKNETVPQLIQKIRSTLENVSLKKFTDKEFEDSRGFLIGSYPFSFEGSSRFLGQLIQLDHEGRDHEEFFKLPLKVKKIREQEVAAMTKSIFDWDKQSVVILGTKSLRKKLEKLGPVKIINYKDFL